MRMTLRARKRVAWCCALVLLMAATSCAISAPAGTTAVSTATSALGQVTATATINPSARTPTSPAAPKVVTVMIVLDSSTDILRFSPSTVTIRVGDSVQWVNDTTAPHTSTSDPGDPAPWDGTMMKWHDTYTVHFAVAGSYTYSCAIHPNMMGTVIVTG